MNCAILPKIIFFSIIFIQANYAISVEPETGEINKVLEKVSNIKLNDGNSAQDPDVNVDIKENNGIKDIYIIREKHFKSRPNEIEVKIEQPKPQDEKVKLVALPARVGQQKSNSLAKRSVALNSELPFYVQFDVGHGIGMSTSGSSYESTTNDLMKNVKNFQSESTYALPVYLGASFGARFSKYTRAEIAVSDVNIFSQANSTISGNRVINTTNGTTGQFSINDEFGAIRNIPTVLFNVAIDTNSDRSVYASFGAGAGLSFISFASSQIKDAPIFTYNGFAQLNWRMYDNITLFAQYKYIGFVGREFDVKSPIIINNAASANGLASDYSNNRVLTRNDFSLDSFGINVLSIGAKISFNI